MIHSCRLVSSRKWHTTVNLNNTVNLTICTAFSGIIHDISCILGYGNYPEGYPSGYSGYGYGGQASTTPVSTPVATQPAPITGLEFFLFDYDLPIDFEYRISSYSCRGNYSFLNSSKLDNFI